MTDTHGLAPLQQFALNDRLANYGDGTFTTMQVSDGKVALLNRHIDRLVNDSQALGLTVAADAMLVDGDGGIDTVDPTCLYPFLLSYSDAVVGRVGHRQEGGARATRERLTTDLAEIPSVRPSVRPSALPSRHAGGGRNGATR